MERDMTTLKTEMAAYDSMRENLELDHPGKWVVIHDEALIGWYDSSQLAAEDAIRRFGRGPYLIRKVGAQPVSLPLVVTEGHGSATID